METNQPKQRCEECGEWFEPSLHKRGAQTTCLKEECQRERHRKNCEGWHEANPGKGEWSTSKRRTWAREQNYWAHHRKESPDYREREVARMRAKRKAASRRTASLKTVANRDSVRQILLEKLECIPLSGEGSVANRDSVSLVFARDPRVDQVVSYLKWRETVAN